MKLYKLMLDHNNEDIDTEFLIVCNKLNTVIDYAKTIGLDHVDYEIRSIELISNDVIIRKDG